MKIKKDKKTYSAEILLDSIAPNGVRLTTFKITFPRFILAEVNTHRVATKNTSSSRAIPVKKIRQQVLSNPVIPVFWGKSQKGMQADTELKGFDLFLSKNLFFGLRYVACSTSWLFEKIGLHKQLANRILEPWCWTTMIFSATSYDNLFALRTHKDAQPEFQKLANLMKEAMSNSTPKQLAVGEWHIPMTEDMSDEFNVLSKIKVSVGRTARTSYENQDGIRAFEDDFRLHDRLVNSVPIHASPTEHSAMCMSDGKGYGNFNSFKQYRQFLEQMTKEEIELYFKGV